MPGPVSNGNAAAAAAAAARRAAEEAARRAAEAARKKAQEAARKKAQEAQKQAQAQRQKAQHAADQARQKQHAAAQASQKAKKAEDEARQKQAELQAKQRQLHNDPSASPKDRQKATNELKVEQKKVADATEHAAKLRADANHAQDAADKAHQNAIKHENDAITSEKAANEAARTAGHDKVPFAEADKVKNALDAGSLSNRQQQKLFGDRSVVTAREAAHEDALQVSEAAKQGPKAGAAALEKQLKANDNPEYRKELFNSTKTAREDIAKSAASKDTSPADAAATVKSLNRAADTIGPDAVKDTAQTLKDGAHDAGAGGSDRLNAALKANVKDPATARVAVELASQYRAGGEYDKADAIKNLSPDLQKFAAASTGESRARDAVRVHGVDGQRTQAGQQVDKIGADTNKKADAALKLANTDPKKLPKGVTVNKTDPNHVEIIKKQNGKVVSRTEVAKDGDQTTYDRTVYAKNGTATRQVQQAGPTGATTEASQWKEARSGSPRPPPTTEQLANSTDPSVRLNRTTITRNGTDANVHTLQRDKNGLTDTTTSYKRQDGTGGIHGAISGKFHDGAVDRAQTTSVFQPNPGVKGPDGKPAKPTVTQGESFSQGGVRADYQHSATTDDVKGPPSTSKLQDVVDKTKDTLGDVEKSPKQWTLQLNKGQNRLDTQTFVEGQDNVSTITHREAHGSTVTESVEAKGIDEHGDSYTAKQTTNTTYDRLGRVTNKHVDATDPKGVHTVQNYSFSRKQTDHGIELDTHATTSRTEPGDPAKTWTQTQDSKSQITQDGPQLLSSHSKVTDPSGNVAETTIDKNGPKSTFNGQSIKPEDIKNLPPEAQQTAALSVATTLKDVKTYAGYGTKGISTISKGLEAFIDGKKPNLENPTEFQTALRGIENRYGGGVSKALRITEGVGGAATAATGVLGLAASAASFVDDVQSGNIVGSVVDAAGVISSGSSVVKGVKGVAAARALGTEAGAIGAIGDALPGETGKIGSLLAKFGSSGLGTFISKLGGAAAVVGVVTSGVTFGKTLFDDNATTVQKVQAGIGFAGAVTAVAVGAAVGGPLGAAVGAGIGLAVIGVQAVVGLFEDKHRVADVKI